MSVILPAQGIQPSGWVPLPTATYISATSFSVPGDLTDRVLKGSKAWLTQTTSKYFYILTAAFSAGATTFTITGGSDYSLANAAITSPYFSNAQVAVGFPEWFNYTPSPSATGPLTLTSVTTYYARFSMAGRTCYVQIGFEGTLGGSAGPLLTFLAPVISIASGTIQRVMFGNLINAGAAEAGKIRIELGTTTFSVQRGPSSNFSTTGAGGVYGNFFYEVG